MEVCRNVCSYVYVFPLLLCVCNLPANVVAVMLTSNLFVCGGKLLCKRETLQLIMSHGFIGLHIRQSFSSVLS